MNGKQKEGGVVSFFENTRKPAGLGGKIMVAIPEHFSGKLLEVPVGTGILTI